MLFREQCALCSVQSNVSQKIAIWLSENEGVIGCNLVCIGFQRAVCTVQQKPLHGNEFWWWGGDEVAEKNGEKFCANWFNFSFTPGMSTGAHYCGREMSPPVFFLLDFDFHSYILLSTSFTLNPNFSHPAPKHSLTDVCCRFVQFLELFFVDNKCHSRLTTWPLELPLFTQPSEYRSRHSGPLQIVFYTMTIQWQFILSRISRNSSNWMQLMQHKAVQCKWHNSTQPRRNSTFHTFKLAKPQSPKSHMVWNWAFYIFFSTAGFIGYFHRVNYCHYLHQSGKYYMCWTSV